MPVVRDGLEAAQTAVPVRALRRATEHDEHQQEPRDDVQRVEVVSKRAGVKTEARAQALIPRAVSTTQPKTPKDMLREPAEGIRATVIGAGEYTVQASGNTSYISDAGVLPVHGLKVIRATLKPDRPALTALKQSLAKFDLTSWESGLALSLSLDGPLDYKTIRAIAEAVAAVCGVSDGDRSPLYLALDLDVAKSLGGILKEELEFDREIIAIDGIEVGDLDFIDIGEPMGITEVIPVTVKSLMFPGTKLD